MSSEKNTSDKFRKLSWLSLIALLGVILAYGLLPVPDAAQRLAKIPNKDYNYSSTEIALTEDELDFLGQAKAVKRLYQLSDGNSVMLLIVDGTQDRHVLHNPAFCLKGASKEILAKTTVPLLNGQGATLKVQTDSGFQEMTYWYSNAYARHSSFPRLLWQSMVNRVTMGHFGNAPVMVILYSPSNRSILWNRMPDQLPFLMDL